MFEHDFMFDFTNVFKADPAPLHIKQVGVTTEPRPYLVHDSSIDTSYTYLFIYTLDGEGIIESEDGTRTIIKKHDAAFLFRPSQTSFCGNADCPTPWRFMHLKFIGTPMIKEYCMEIITTTNNTFHLSPEAPSIVSAINIIASRLAGFYNHPKLAYAASFDFICKLYCDTVAKKHDYSTLTNKSIAIMEEQYGTLSGIQELADMLRVSPEHLSRKFTQDTGMSPIKFLNAVRIQNSIQLLINSTYNIQQIAIICGFQSSINYTKTFKNKMSITPSEYRKKGGN